MTLRRSALTLLLAAPLLALGACGDSADDGEAATSAPVAAVTAPAGQQWVDQAEITPEGGWRIGNPNAPLKLVEYGSLTCPACAAFSQQGMEALRNNYINSGRVSYELRSVPIHGAIDLVLTRLLECAPKESAHPLAEQLWANNEAVVSQAQAAGPALEQTLQLPPAQRYIAFAQQTGLLDFMAARGISTDQARQCLADGAAMEKLANRMQAQNEKDQITGTPTFFLNGARLDTTSWASTPAGAGVEAALQNAGAR